MESWIEHYGLGIAVALSAPAILGILRWIGFKPVVKLFGRAGALAGWVRGQAVRLLILKRSGRKETPSEIKERWIQDQIRRHERLIHENRYLALQNRRDAYVRVCRQLAPDIHVDSDHEPKLLVWIRDGNEPEYVWLTPSGEIENNRWATHPDLSRRLSELFEGGSGSVWLSVVLPYGRVAGLEIKTRHVSYVPYADNTHRAILTLEPFSGLYSVVDEMKAIILLLGTIGWPAAALAKKNSLIPSEEFLP